MRQALVPLAAWSLATGAAVALSWWGVHSVMTGTAYDPPRAVPIAAGGTAPGPSAAPLVPATQRPESPSGAPSPPPSGPSASPGPGGGNASGAGSPSAAPSPSSPSTKPSPRQSGTVRSYVITGGRAVFSVDATSASLVSATPDAGWRVQTWTQPEWVRVTFTKGSRESSVFYTWNGHKPLAQFDAR
ncbi:hypothetical protein [Streptomyces sp. 8L]|uniref:hypothetical protein n=1 Tax=Streptomyces sp. 8L TaxID=2877242 RepID=UPI001CD22C54|nr:hypothetical protein [Streptomyces sp. 8L]MCA1222146.1 hypothetical protein [Streptomyces sp. 8L]